MSIKLKALRIAGRLLYGDPWQSPLARDLLVSDRTVRRWVAGDSDPPDGIEDELRDLLERRGVAISQTLKGWPTSIAGSPPAGAGTGRQDPRKPSRPEARARRVPARSA